MPVGHRLRERSRDGWAEGVSLYPVTLGCGTLGTAVGSYAAGTTVPAVVLAALGGLVLVAAVLDGDVEP